MCELKRSKFPRRGFVLVRVLTGYGDKIERPIGASLTFIALFAGLFWLTDGIVKNVNGTIVSRDGLLTYITASQPSRALAIPISSRT
jgi:hypothetical protein